MKKIVLSKHEFCVVVEPIDKKGKPQFGKRELRKGCNSFFLHPGKYLLNDFKIILLTPGNDRGDASDSISQSNQIWFPLFRSIEHERVHKFHSEQFSC